MKKIIFALLIFAGSFSTAFAQNKTADKAKEQTKEVKKKADGTPDMRYKENQGKAKAEGPKKADGTPDMRYKENKEKETKTKTTEVKKEVKKKG